MVTILIVALIAFLAGIVVMFGIHKVHEYNERIKSTMWQIKQQLDQIEQVQDSNKDQRNSYAVNETTENVTAILKRLHRDVGDFNQYVKEVETWTGLVGDELNRAANLVTTLRASGTKRGNGK